MAVDTSGLNRFVSLFGLLPVLDLRCELHYAYLENDVIQKRPRVDLALGGHFPDLDSKITARRCLSPRLP